MSKVAEPEPAPTPEARRLAGGYQGTVYLIETPHGPRVVKKASGRGLLRALRRAMLRREHAIYEQLHGVAGVPRTYGLDAEGQLLLEYVAGHSLRETRLQGSDHAHFFAELRELILGVHAAGVAHGDLKRKDNIIVGPDNRPFLVDFGTAIAVSPAAGWWRRLIWQQLCRVDLNAWIKLKYQGVTDGMDPADRPYFRPTLVERVIRPIRQTWRKLTLRRWRKRRKLERH